MTELKQVLIVKAEEHRCREEKAIERKNMKRENFSEISVNKPLKGLIIYYSFGFTAKTKSSRCPSSNEDSKENGQSSKSIHSGDNLKEDRNDLQIQETSSKEPEIESSNQDKKENHIGNGGGDFEHFFDLQNVAPVSTKIDPFCPNGTSYRSCQNGFDDDFLSQSNKESDNSIVSQERDDTSDEDDDVMSSSSSHASTIKSGKSSSFCFNMCPL
jgi:hypothetical protein